MHFVLDANVLFDEGFGNSARLKTLLSASSAVGYKVYVPETALVENSANYARELDSKIREARKPLKRLSWMLGRDLNTHADGIDIESETELMRSSFKYQLKTAEAIILEYPKTPHEILVKSATSRRRPFDNNGSGYRDALIWQSVLELANRVEGNIVLVSNDKDFRGSSNDLHDDLIEDLENLRLPKDKVVLVTRLPDLVDEHVRPYLGKAPWEKPLDILAEMGMNLEESIGLIIQDACAGKEWDPTELDLPGEYESPTLDAVHDVSGLNVVDARQLPNDKYLVKIETQILGEIDVFVYKSDWYTTDDPRLFLVDADWNDHYVLATIAMPLHCEINLVVEGSEAEHVKIQDVSVTLRAEES